MQIWTPIDSAISGRIWGDFWTPSKLEDTHAGAVFDRYLDTHVVDIVGTPTDLDTPGPDLGR